MGVNLYTLPSKKNMLNVFLSDSSLSHTLNCMTLKDNMVRIHRLLHSENLLLV